MAAVLALLVEYESLVGLTSSATLIGYALVSAGNFFLSINCFFNLAFSKHPDFFVMLHQIIFSKFPLGVIKSRFRRTPFILPSSGRPHIGNIKLKFLNFQISFDFCGILFLTML
jgi:hypothetical protein